MPGDSVRASKQGLAIVGQACKSKGWTKYSTAAWWLAANVGRSTLSRFWRREKISRSYFIAICKAVGILEWQRIAELEPAEPGSTILPEWVGVGVPDLDLEHFFGRETELQQLQDWILKEDSKLIAVLGMGGIGKTSLALALGDALKNNFDRLIWYSLQDEPPLQTLLANLSPFLTGSSTSQPLNTDTDASLYLLNYLQNNRCLLVLDNAESILEGRADSVSRRYRSGYENYETLFRQIGAGRHRSCLLITSREQPQGFTQMTGHKIRCLSVQGVSPIVGYRILTNDLASPPQLETCQGIITHYGGNPLALKIVSAGIRDYLGGDIAYLLERLQEGSFPFTDIRDLLQRQIERLSEREQEVLFWLAIVREPTSLAELEACLLSTLSQRELPATLESLYHRSLIVTTSTGYTLQPVVMEYLIQRLMESIILELRDWNSHLQLLNQQRLSNSYLNQYALMQATAKDYIRENQIRLIVKPILEDFQQLLLSLYPIVLELWRIDCSYKSGYLIGNLLNLMVQSGASLGGANFSHLAIRQAYLKGVELHGVNFTGARFQQVVFSEMMSNVMGIAFHPNGKILASVDDKGWLYLWDIQGDRQIASIKAHLEWTFALAFSPDGQMLATAGLDWVIKLWHWDGHTLQLRFSLEGHTIGVSSVTFHPTGEWLASASADKTVKLWNLKTGKCHCTFYGHEDIVRSVAFSADGKILASGSWDQTIRLWDVQTGACLSVLRGHGGQVESITFSGKSDVLISGSYDRTIKLWDTQQGHCLQTLTGHHDRVCVVTCTMVTNEAQSDEPQCLIASAGDDGTIRLWDGLTGNCSKILVAGKERIWDLEFDAQGKVLASGSQERLLKLWDVQTGQCWRTFHGSDNQTTPFGFSPDGEIVYTYGYRDQSLIHWQWSTGQQLKTRRLDVRTSMDVRLSPDGQFVAVAGFDHMIKLFKIDTGACCQQLVGHQGWVRTIVFSSSGQWLVSGSGDGTARLWDWQTGQELQIFAYQNSPVQCVAVSSDGTYLATGNWEHQINLWDIQTGKLLKTLEGHTHRVEDVVFSLDGSDLYSCSLDGTIRVWQVETGQCIDTWSQSGDGVVCLNLSPDGTLLACANYRSAVIMRQLPNGREAWKQFSANLIYGITVFAPDNRTIAVRGTQGSCQIWSIDDITGKPLQSLQVPQLYEGMNITEAIGLTQAQRETLQMLGAIGV